jgi:hypothetical protein
MFTSGTSHGEAIGSYRGEPLYHASLAAREYQALLESNGFRVEAHSVEDPLLHERDSIMMYMSLVQVTQTMAQSFTISTARQKFFALFQTVTGHRGRKVVISRRVLPQ